MGEAGEAPESSARRSASVSSIASSSACRGASPALSSSAPARSARSLAASAVSVSTTPASARAASDRSMLRRFSPTRADSPRARASSDSAVATASPRESAGRAARAASDSATPASNRSACSRASASSAPNRSRFSPRAVRRSVSVVISRPARWSRMARSSPVSPPWRRAASAWRSSGLRCRRTSFTRSPRRSRLTAVASRRRSAFSLRWRYLRIPAASSMTARRSSGRAWRMASRRPCPTMTCWVRPIPVWESSSVMSRSRHGWPLMA